MLSYAVSIPSASSRLASIALRAVSLSSSSLSGVGGRDGFLSFESSAILSSEKQRLPAHMSSCSARTAPTSLRSDLSEGERLHGLRAALDLAAGPLLTLLLVSRGDSGFQWEAVVYPLPVAQRQLPELMVAELQVAECRSCDAESDCCVFLRNPRCDSFSPHFRPLPLDGYI